MVPSLPFSRRSIPVTLGHGRRQKTNNQTQYITKTFSLAAPNLSINGLPVSPSSLTSCAASQSTAAAPTAYEPFDAERRQRVADLITQEEKLLEEVAALKRSVPGQAAAEAASRVGDAIRRDEDLLQAREARVLAQAREEGGAALAVDGAQRQQSVEEGFAAAVGALGRLKRDMPAVVARMERARVAGEYVVEGK